MKKRTLFFLSLSLVASLGIGWLWLTENDSVEAQSNPPTVHPLEEINRKAKLARNGSQSDAEEYVRDIISISGFAGELSGFTSTAVKVRVGRSESRYRQGLAAGIPEGKIVRTVNGLVRKFNLPDFTKTSAYEVRRLRLGLILGFPQIITQKSQGSSPVSVGSQIDAQMSPAEAVFVLAMMLQQKLANPEFQMTRTERVSRWSAAHSHSAGPNNSVNLSQTRSREIEIALQQAAASTSMSDALHLSGVTLNTLGIEQ